jgi:hypothetical protein
MNHQIKAFRQATTAAAKDAAQRFGHIPPMVSVLMADNYIDSSLIPLKFLEYEHAKELLAKMVIPDFLKEIRKAGKQPICVAIIMDGYLTQIMEKPENLSIKQLRDKYKHTRVEVLSVSYSTEDGDFSDVTPYDRTEDGKIVFRDTEEKTTILKESRFANLLKKQ